MDSDLGYIRVAYVDVKLDAIRYTRKYNGVQQDPKCEDSQWGMATDVKAGIVQQVKNTAVDFFQTSNHLSYQTII
jgi:hypothetical protein